MTKIIDRAAIDFLLFDVLDVESLCGRGLYADHDRVSLTAALDLAERIAEEHLWPHAGLSDQQEPRLENGDVRILPEAIAALQVLQQAGFFSAHCDYAHGGQQLPVAVNQACNGMFKGANVATHAYMSLTRAAANLLDAHGSEAQKRLFMAPMLEGRFFGTMCLSEPSAGSSLVDIRTRAEPLGNGHYAITGNKMWISAGDHDAAENIVHLVLARTPGAPAGVKGISLFAVPKIQVNEDGSLGACATAIAVAGLNHKMGWRGTSNCLLNFGEDGRPPSDYRVGEEHRGLVYMFHMMNEARIGVGLGGAMLASVAYRIALDYAKERKQGRRLSDKDPAAPPVALIAHPDVRRMLLKQKVYSEGGLALCLYAGSLVDRRKVADDAAERARLDDLLDVLTPVVKAWPSEFGLEANKLAMQVLGGYGYTRDFPLERLYRDNRLNMIHEGTNGIQALDLLGRKAVMNDGRAFEILLSEIDETAQTATGDAGLRDFAVILTELLGQARRRTAEVRAGLQQGQGEEALAHATPFLHGLGHLIVGWLWLRQALAARAALEGGASATEAAFLQGKIDACRFFFDQEIPEARTWLEISGRDANALFWTSPRPPSDRWRSGVVAAVLHEDGEELCRCALTIRSGPWGVRPSKMRESPSSTSKTRVP